MLRRLAEMKGAEHMSELDKAKLELALAAKEKKVGLLTCSGLSNRTTDWSCSGLWLR